MSERGISNILGYTLMFGIIITATIGVSVIASDQLVTVRDGEQLSNAERGFLIIDRNIDEIQTGRAAVRSGAIDLNNGQLGFTSDSDSAIRVRVFDSGPGSDDEYDERIPMRALVYELGDSSVGYEGGAVFRADNGNSVMKQEPRFLCTDDTALVSVVTLQGDTGRSLGSGTVSIRTAEDVSRLRFPVNESGPDSTDGQSTVSVDVGDTQFTESWVRNLERSEWSRVGSSTEFRCADVDTYYVRQSVVDLRLVQ